jgi:hypothetical protein
MQMAKYRSKGIQLAGKPCTPTPALVLDFTNAVHAVFAPDVGGLLRLKAAAPIKPAKPQKPCDDGLFSDTANQQELF